MSKELKDYLHLYLGCDFIGKFKGWAKRSEIMILCPDDLVSGKFEEIKPILRKLSSMTEEEAKPFFNFKSKYEIYKKVVAEGVMSFQYRWKDDKIKPNTSDGYCHSEVGISLAGWQLQLNPDKFYYLLSKGFDLFDLIDDGLAIDKESLNQ